jgi:hypothetical protein
MSIRITHVRLAGGYRDHEHITDFRWISYESGEVGESTKQVLVDWLAGGGNAYVESPGTRVPVGVVRPEGRLAYVRTYANDRWTDNLLSLDRF